MNDETNPAPENAPALKIPVDPWVLLYGIARRWVWLVIILAAAVGTGFFALSLAAKRIYKTETILLYDAPVANEEGQSSVPSLFTEIAMVKMPLHIEELRKRHALHATVEQIAQAVTVSIEPKTSLVTLAVQWDDAQEATNIANGLRDIFLESRQRVHREKILSSIAMLDKRLAPVREQLAAADKKLGDYAKENQIVDLTEEAKALLQEQMTVNVLHDQALTEQAVVNKQAANVKQIISQVKERVAQEAREAAAYTDALSETNIRIQRLRESISDDQKNRVEGARLAEKRLAVARAKEALAARAISKAEYDTAVSELRVQEAITLETTQTQDWKGQIKQLDTRVIPNQGGNTASGNLLLAVLTREFEIQMQAVSAQEKVTHIHEALTKITDRIARIPLIERRYVELKRQVATLEAEATGLESSLANARKELELRGARFSTIVEAKLPIRPSKSNTKLIFAGAVVGVSGLGALVVLLSVLLSLRTSTLLEVESWTAAPALGEIARATGFPEDDQQGAREAFLTMTSMFRQQHTEKGVVLLLAGADGTAPTGDVALGLARSLAARGEQVVVIVADVRSSPKEGAAPRRSILEWFIGRRSHGTVRPLPGAALTAPGLAAYIEGRHSTLAAVAARTSFEGVRVVRCEPGEVDPHWLASPSMVSLLATAKASVDAVIVVGPPVMPWADAGNLAALCDVAALVVRAGSCSYFTVKAAATVLKKAQPKFVGTVLTHVETPYLRTRYPEEHGN